MTSTPWVDGLTIGQVLHQTAERFGAQDALVFPHANLRLSWAEMNQAVSRIARGLLAIGLQRGDHFIKQYRNVRGGRAHPAPRCFMR